MRSRSAHRYTVLEKSNFYENTGIDIDVSGSQGFKYWYPLGGMKLAEGISLLTKLKIEGTDKELEDFVSYVDGHPLTIELAAGYLREYCQSQLSQVAELGLKQFELIYQEASGLHRKGQDARLSWIIQQHLNRLTKEQKNFLSNLSVYRLPFDREAAGYMWIEEEVKPIVIQKKLQQLYNRSLLTKTQNNQYLFQPLVREYLHQQEKPDLTTAHQQAIAYYQSYLKEEQSWRVLEDVSEYLEIVYHYCELEQYALAKDTIDSCVMFLYLRGYYSVLVELYEQLIPRWQDNLQPEDRSELADSLNGLGIAYRNLGEYRQAIDYFQQSLEIAREIGDRYLEGDSLNNLGNAYNYLGEYQQAIDYYQQSLEIAREIGDRSGEGISLNNLGNAYNDLGEYRQAIDYFQQSLEIAREIGNRQGEGGSLGNLGNAYNFLGEYRQAIDYHQQSLEIAREIGNRSGEGISLANLGLAYNSLGEYQRAINYLQQSLEIAREIGDKRLEAETRSNLGTSWKNLQQKSEAKTAYENARKLYQAMGLEREVENCNEAIKNLDNNILSLINRIFSRFS